MTVISDYVLWEGSFLLRAFHAILRETGVYISTFLISLFADRFTVLSDW